MIIDQSINIDTLYLFKYIHRPLRLFTFSTSSPEPLDGFWWNFGIDEVLKVPYKCCCFSARSVQGRIQGGAKLGHGGPLLQETSSSDRKATATNRMHSRDLETCGKKCCYFWFHSEVKFLTRFWRLFGLSQICLILCNFYRFLCGKELYLH